MQPSRGRLAPPSASLQVKHLTMLYETEVTFACLMATSRAYSEEIATTHLKPKISQGAWERLEWHRNQGHRLVLVTATVAPMAEAMARVLGMDEVYGCDKRSYWMAFWFRTWMVCTKAKGKVPVVEQDAEKHGHDLSKCYGYGNTLADSWFMRICGHAIAVNPESSLEQFAQTNDWEIVHWPS